MTVREFRHDRLSGGRSLQAIYRASARVPIRASLKMVTSPQITVEPAESVEKF
ncbi:MAG: hypothetical protein ACRDGG_09035 [Anaerolineae bacterium]